MEQNVRLYLHVLKDQIERETEGLSQEDASELYSELADWACEKNDRILADWLDSEDTENE